MRIIDQVTFKINEFFLGYLIYGEPEGLREEEIAAIDKFINELAPYILLILGDFL